MIYKIKDNWTVTTINKRLFAQFEHTLAVTNKRIP